MSIALRRNHSQQALSMVELLIGMALGLFLMAAILQLFLGNNRIYRFQEGLSSVQPNARAASEFLARDIRMGGFTGCHPGLPIANVLNDPDTRWWTNFTAGGVIGYDGSQPFTGQPFGTEVGQRVPGTDAIVLLGAGRQGYSIVTQNPIDETFTLDNLHQLSTGSILVA
ncbi:PilW family protein, partial [Halochromatium sp.]